MYMRSLFSTTPFIKFVINIGILSVSAISDETYSILVETQQVPFSKNFIFFGKSLVYGSYK